MTPVRFVLIAFLLMSLYVVHVYHFTTIGQLLHWWTSPPSQESVNNLLNKPL